MKTIKKKTQKYKVLNGVPVSLDKAVCHHCGSGPMHTLLDNLRRRVCNRCEINFCICKRCRELGYTLTPVIVNDPLISFATGQKRNWWCDSCAHEIGLYD